MDAWTIHLIKNLPAFPFNAKNGLILLLSILLVSIALGHVLLLCTICFLLPWCVHTLSTHGMFNSNITFQFFPKAYHLCLAMLCLCRTSQKCVYELCALQRNTT